MVPNDTVVQWSLQLCKFAHAVVLGRWPSTCSRCDIFHSEPTLPARLYHHPHTDGHFHRTHAPVRLAHADRLTGCTVAVNGGRGYYSTRACRGKPPVKRGAACSMLVSIDWSTHVHVSVRSVRRARGSSVGHSHRATPPCYCVVVMLLRRCTRAKAHPTPFLSICFVMH